MKDPYPIGRDLEISRLDVTYVTERVQSLRNMLHPVR